MGEGASILRTESFFPEHAKSWTLDTWGGEYM
jgi:hypothetical protein